MNSRMKEAQGNRGNRKTHTKTRKAYCRSVQSVGMQRASHLRASAAAAAVAPLALVGVFPAGNNGLHHRHGECVITSRSRSVPHLCCRRARPELLKGVRRRAPWVRAGAVAAGVVTAAVAAVAVVTVVAVVSTSTRRTRHPHRRTNRRATRTGARRSRHGCRMTSCRRGERSRQNHRRRPTEPRDTHENKTDSRDAATTNGTDGRRATQTGDNNRCRRTVETGATRQAETAPTA